MVSFHLNVQSKFSPCIVHFKIAHQTLDIMKYLVFNFILFGIFIANSFAATVPEPEMNLMTILNECKIEEKATDADVQGFVRHKIPQNRTGKCLMACAFEKNEDIKGGKINGDGIKTLLANSPGPKSFTNDIINEGQSIENPDRCELAVQFTECMMKGVAKNGPQQRKSKRINFKVEKKIRQTLK